MKISTFKQESHIDSDLIEAVIDQLGGKESFKDHASDIYNYGIDGGFHGFIYHTDTIKFFDDNKDAIIALAQELAGSMGVDLLAMIKGFNCLNGLYSETDIMQGIYEADNDNEIQVKNALAWFAGEEVSRSYMELKENG